MESSERPNVEFYPNHKPILLFDGVCNLCSSTVQFILKNEKDQELRFASLQSDIGIKLLSQFHINTNNTDSIVLIRNQQALTKSDAIISMSSHLVFPWKAISWFSIIPRFIRDSLYDMIAKNRYRFFGKKNTCWIPQKNWKDRFLDN